jgi:transposase
MSATNKYPKEFKLDAFSLLLDQGYSNTGAAKSLGVNANMLQRRVKEYQSGDGQPLPGNGKRTPEQEAIRKLKSQVKRLEMEKDILKKATVFFAKATR